MLSRRILLAGALTAGASYLVLTGKRTASAGTVPAEHWAEKLVKAGQSQIGVTLVYDPAYTALDYPNGDVPRAKGVCTDVIVRAYRDGLGIDPQRLVHEDMKSAFAAYPQKWGLASPDSNIDHRRVPNLQTFFKRCKAELPVTVNGMDYKPGDIVTQMLPGNKTHIVLVSNLLNPQATRPLAIHNIGWGTRIEDVLFAYQVTGHYRFRG
jgi:uncharacterized protein YijF (DUF1287 family)